MALAILCVSVRPLLHPLSLERFDRKSAVTQQDYVVISHSLTIISCFKRDAVAATVTAAAADVAALTEYEIVVSSIRAADRTMTWTARIKTNTTFG